MRCHLSLESNCELNYTPFGVFEAEDVEPSTVTHRIDSSAP